MSTLHLTLNRRWFDMIASGEKKEEYREAKPYWLRRLCHSEQKRQWHCKNNSGCLLCFMCHETFAFEKFDLVEFRNGYANDAPSITFRIEAITYGEGRSDWGAEEKHMYIIIKLGERVK